jgi:hypothetical protein
VRHAITNHIFREPRKGFVAHTRTSRLLAEDIQMQAWTAMYVEDLYLPNASTIKAMDKWPGSQEPTETGCSLALNTKDPFFVEMAKDPARLKRF